MHEFMRSTHGKRVICVLQRIGGDQMIQDQEQGQKERQHEDGDEN